MTDEFPYKGFSITNPCKGHYESESVFRFKRLNNRKHINNHGKKEVNNLPFISEI